MKCPISGENLRIIRVSDIEYMDRILSTIEKCKYGLINESKTLFYPALDDILLLLPMHSIQLSKEQGIDIEPMHFDKNRVYCYYNAIQYVDMDQNKIYSDSSKFVDFRDISNKYFKDSLSRTRKYLPNEGKIYLDAGSGPIGLAEYVNLSEGYDVRICLDLSFNALKQAKRNLRNHDAIYICGDMTNIPLASSVCDVTVSHHALYHIPKNEQKTAVHEMLRVTKDGGKVAIVYNWFYHSWMMNIFIFPIQLYRIARHLAGKAYVRFIDKSKPRLYFYPHPARWFKRLSLGKSTDIYCWRSLNRYFLKIYIHKWLFGKHILFFIERLERKYPKFMGIFGDYPLIIISK